VPKALFETRLGGRSYDVSRDGRFLIPTLAEQAASAPMKSRHPGSAGAGIETDRSW